MALTADQLKSLSELADCWLAADATAQDALLRQARQEGDAFARAFTAMVAQLHPQTGATLLPPISQAMREAAVLAAGQSNAGSAIDANSNRFGATLSDADEIRTREPGQHIGPYRLIKELGRGGMGVVWLAERADGQHSRQVALKMPLVENLNWLLAARFARERNILASLEHPSIARLYDAGVDQADRNAQPYIAIEYVQGQPITDYVKDRRLKPEATAQLFIRVIEAVAHAHTQLVIHRDIKPSNILVDAKGEPHLLDFGIAKLLDDEDSQTADATQLTRLSGRALTLDYASPEQVNNASLGTPSDVYSLGVVLYELLTGRRPYNPKGSTRRDLEQAILDQDPSKPSDQLLTANTGDSESGKSARRMRGDLDTVVLKALRKDPKQRYATAQAFADDLKRYLAYEPIAAKPDSEWYRAGRFVRRNRVLVAVTAALFVAVAAGVMATLSQARRAEREALRATAEAQQRRVEATRANAVSTFLSDIFLSSTMYQSDPQRGQSVTALSLLNTGIDRVEVSLKDEPEAMYAVLKLFQELLINLGRRPDELRVGRKLFDLAKSRPTPVFKDIVRDGINLANALYIEHSQSEAEQTLAQVEPYLDRARAEGWSDESGYYFVKAMVVSARDFDAGVALYEKAELVDRPLAATLTMADRGWRNYVSSATTLASALGWVGRVAEADATLDRVDAMVTSAGREGWVFKARVDTTRGHVFATTGRPAQAITTLRNVLDRYQSRGQSEHWHAVRVKALMIEPLSLVGQWQEARALAAEVQSFEAQRSPNSDLFWQWSMMQAVALADSGEISAACGQMQRVLTRSAGRQQRGALVNEFGALVVTTCAHSRSHADGAFAAALFADEISLARLQARLGRMRGEAQFMAAQASVDIFAGRTQAAHRRLAERLASVAFDNPVLIADELVMLALLCESGLGPEASATCERFSRRAQLAADTHGSLPTLPALSAAAQYHLANQLQRFGLRREAVAAAKASLALQSQHESPQSENLAKSRSLVQTFAVAQ